MSDIAENTCHVDELLFSSQLRGKRLVWEASVSSLKSKRVKGSRVADDSLSSDKNCDPLYDHGNYACFSEHSFAALGYCQLLNRVSNFVTHSNLKAHSHGERLTPDSDGRGVIKGNCPRILFMNIADDDKKSKLTKIVKKLDSSISLSGSSSTHVITWKARQTLNFCISLCSGTWIVSANWFKSSFREGKFLDESQHILEDEDYRLKYKCKLRDVVIRTKANPHSLLRGFQVCLSKHIQPSINDLSSITLYAGGSHSFVVKDFEDSQFIHRSLIMDSSKVGVPVTKSYVEDLSFRDAKHSGGYTELLSNLRPIWDTNSTDDMCQIFDKDAFPRVGSSFNPMSEPFDEWPSKFYANPEHASLNNLGESSNGVFTSPCEPTCEEDDYEVTEWKIRAFLDEKALDLKKLQTPLYEEFFNSLSAIPEAFDTNVKDGNGEGEAELPSKNSKLLSNKIKSRHYPNVLIMLVLGARLF